MFRNVNDLPDIEKLINDRYITKRAHPEFPLDIYNYTQKAQFDNLWNEATLSCRGLICASDGSVVSRPFRKFFNMKDVNEIPDEDYDVFEKLDGSLGISYFWNHRHWIATRGSFDSEQAAMANKMLDTEYAFVTLDPAHTYLFEITGPRNRIVVSYPFDRLVLLAQIISFTGYEIPDGHKKPGFPSPVMYDIDLDDPFPTIPNFEGFVIRFVSGLRVKVKQDEYLRLHMLKTQMSPLAVWELLANNVDIGKIMENTPDEFLVEIHRLVDILTKQYLRVEAQATHVFKARHTALLGIGRGLTRKEYAEYFHHYGELRPILFKMLDGKSYRDIIWKMIRPKGGEVNDAQP